MRPHPRQSQIRPKVSTMPREKTEAAAYLSIYKLVNEKKRLQQELEQLEQRRDRVQQRLTAIETQVEQLEQGAHDLKENIPLLVRQPMQEKVQDSSTFSTLFLEY